MSNIPDIIPLEFVSGKKGSVKHGQANILMPLVGIDGVPEDIPDIPLSAKVALSEVYSGPNIEMPADIFIRYYYVALTIIGLYVVFRVLIPGRRQ